MTDSTKPQIALVGSYSDAFVKALQDEDFEVEQCDSVPNVSRFRQSDVHLRLSATVARDEDIESRGPCSQGRRLYPLRKRYYLNATRQDGPYFLWAYIDALGDHSKCNQHPHRHPESWASRRFTAPRVHVSTALSCTHALTASWRYRVDGMVNVASNSTPSEAQVLPLMQSALKKDSKMAKQGFQLQVSPVDLVEQAAMSIDSAVSATRSTRSYVSNLVT